MLGRSTVVLALKWPTAPLNPGSSGIGLTSIVTGLVERWTTPPASKNDWRWTAMLRVEAGQREASRLGRVEQLHHHREAPVLHAVDGHRRAAAVCEDARRSSTQKPVNSRASANWSPLDRGLGVEVVGEEHGFADVDARAVRIGLDAQLGLGGPPAAEGTAERVLAEGITPRRRRGFTAPATTSIGIAAAVVSPASVGTRTVPTSACPTVLGCSV